jgi:hypothetical protein
MVWKVLYVVGLWRKMEMKDRDSNSIFDRFTTGSISKPLVDTISPIPRKITDPGYHHPSHHGRNDPNERRRRRVKEKKRRTTPLSNLSQTPLKFLTPPRLFPTFHNISNPSPLDPLDLSFLNSFLCFSF